MADHMTPGRPKFPRIQGAHKWPGTLSCKKGMPIPSPVHLFLSCSYLVRQHWQCFLYQQTRGNETAVCTEAVNLWNWCISHQILLSAAYLFGTQNVFADLLSRHFAIRYHWELHDSVVHNFFTRWGILTRDLFALHINNKCTTYCSSRSLSHHSQDDVLLVRPNQ